MKTTITKKMLLVAIPFFVTFTCSAVDNVIVLTPTVSGSLGSENNSDESVFRVNAITGAVTNDNSSTTDDWIVSPVTVTVAGAKGKTFSVKYGAMSTYNTNVGVNYGAMFTAGGIDRSSVGELGVLGGANNGINVNEGYWFGLDASNIPSSVYIQITKIKVKYARTLTGYVVNRLKTSNQLFFGNSITPTLVDGQGWLDLSSFNCTITGSLVNSNMISIFCNYSTNVTDNFKVTGIELKVMDNFDCAVIKTVPHPRLLLKRGEEASVNQLIGKSTYFKYIHDYILSTCDSMLRLPAFVRVIDASGALPVAIDVTKRIFYLSYGYRMTGDNRYLTKAVEDINTVCNFYDWNSSKDLDYSEICFGVAIGYDWLYDSLTEATKQKARLSILNFALKASVGRGFWDMTSNWNQVCIGGLTLGALAIYGDGTAAMDAQAKIIMDAILLKNPNAMNMYGDGNYNEGPMYWNYGTTYEVLMLSALESIYGNNHSGLNGLINTSGFLESARYMLYVTGTSGLVHNYSDGIQPRIPAPAAFWMAKKMNDISLLFLEKQMMQDHLFTTNDPNTARFLPIILVHANGLDMDNLSAPINKVWSGKGVQPITLVRTEWQGSTGRFLGVKAGTPNFSHAHMDGGSFVYDAQGQRWAMDFEKEDYVALKVNNVSSSYNQTSTRWDVFRIGNISHNTLSIKKTSSNGWQHHVAGGVVTQDSVYNTLQRRGAKVNLTNVIGLNKELKSAIRTVTIEDNTYLKVVDSIVNGAESVDVYWNMATSALVKVIDASTVQLIQGGKTVLMKVTSSSMAVPFIIETNRSTDPVDYIASHTYERKNFGKVMVGFTATIPADTVVKFTVTLTDGPEMPSSVSVSVNQILLDLPNPLTAYEGYALFSDASRFDINSNGKVVISGYATKYAWTPYGDINISDTWGKNFSFNWKAMGTTSTTMGSEYGALLTQAGIDRSNIGELGVRGGLSNGIDKNEGYQLGLDLTNMPVSVSLQLSGVAFSSLSTPDQCIVVNRKNTNLKKTVTANGYIDIKNLNIIINGGSNDNDFASIFNTGKSGDFRITGFKFDIIKNENTGIMEGLRSQNEIAIFPNPFNNYLLIEKIIEPSHMRVNIINSNGACVFEKEYSISDVNAEISMNLSSLKTGIYLCQIFDNKGLTVKKIIKK